MRRLAWRGGDADRAAVLAAARASGEPLPDLAPLLGPAEQEAWCAVVALRIDVGRSPTLGEFVAWCDLAGIDDHDDRLDLLAVLRALERAMAIDPRFAR
jgi:hypothetical protein